MRQSLAIAFTFLAACGGGSSKPPMPDAPGMTSHGFDPPTKSLKVCTKTGGCSSDADFTPADLSCLNTPSSDVATTVAVTLTSVVKDFQSGNVVPNAMVIAFDGVNFSAPFDTEMGDGNGNITFNVPAGRKRFGFKMTTSDGQTMPTFLLNQYLDPNMATQTIDKIQSVSVSTAETLPALIGEQRTAGTGVLAGALRDCQHHEIANFIATVSTTQGTATPLTGAESYYFSPGVDLPVRNTQQPASSSDGLFMVIQLPATQTAYVQMWGFPTDADLTAGTLKEISELQVPVLGDTVITGSYEPLRQ